MKKQLFFKTCRIVLILLIIFLFPQFMIFALFSPHMYSDLARTPSMQYGIVFGATVYEDEVLSEITRERIAAAVFMYQNRKVKKLFISGDNRHNREVDNIIEYAVTHGVDPADIIADHTGIDTHDTCRHFKALAGEKALLFTQGFHLPRAMLMCQRNGIEAGGVIVNRLGLFQYKVNTMKAWFTRTTRFFRECSLTWAYITGLYDLLSNEAEEMENRQGNLAPLHKDLKRRVLRMNRVREGRHGQ